jgi:hypothetical protein
MLKCQVCSKVIPKERIDIFLELGKDPPQFCTEHSQEQKVIGFMGETGGKEGRKTGYSLVMLNPNARNFRENYRRAIRVHKRSR